MKNQSSIDTDYGIAGGAAGRRRDATAADRWRLVGQEVR